MAKMLHDRAEGAVPLSASAEMGGTMTKSLHGMAEGKRIWTRPALNRLGTVKDVAGPDGASAQSPIQLRS